MECVQVTTIIAALATCTGMQAFWISRALDRVGVGLDRIDLRLDRIEGGVLRDHAERIARPEAAHDS